MFLGAGFLVVGIEGIDAGYFWEDDAAGGGVFKSGFETKVWRGILCK